ncbi:SDR family NAD(P)-dependent oxidoreductase [Mycolicibacterium moriokaense]|nr:SDR family NAD(P)-dependent oxidoreductase [Mycolicibacterium moriokaense]
MTANWTPARLGDLTGKRIIVTGATNGVGLGTARALVRAGAHVVMAVRNTELAAQRAKEIGGSTSIMKVDLAEQASVRAFADALDEDVDILINNAGMLTQEREETVDGFEKTIAVNLLGPFALTNLVFPRVRSQIINVGSQAHRGGTLRLDDMHLRAGKWTALGAYARAKLAVMLWGLDLDRRLRQRRSPVVTQLTHPGWVASNLSHISDSPVMALADRVVRRAANSLGNDIDAGAATTLYCISEPIPPGTYVGIDGKWGLKGGPVMIGRSAIACDYEAAAKLVEFAEKETGTTLPD